MSTNSRVIKATREQVWEILADGWLYPLWVVGASRMREVEGHWPTVGSRIHHSVGAWPLLIDDHTEVLEATPGVLLKLRAKAWPAGVAAVTLHLRPTETETENETEVVLEEDAVEGPGSLVPKPLRDGPLRWRNVEALRRLAYVCERRPTGHGGD